MAYANLSALWSGRAHRAAGLSALLLALAVGGHAASAQQAATDQPAPAAGDQAPAAPAAAPATADPAKPAVYWVKICDKMQIPDPAAKDPKTAKPIDRGFCLTQHERLDGNSGSILVAAAIREDEGVPKKGLLVTVPLGMIIPAGLGVVFDDEKDEKKIIKLAFDACLPSGCTAEVEASPELIDQMGKAKVMQVLAVSVQGIRVNFKVPMGGFATVMAGKPTDTAKYFNARKNKILEIRERLLAKQQATQAAAGAALKGLQEDQAAAAKEAGTAAPADPAAKTTTGN